jgi:hypothetical protein
MLFGPGVIEDTKAKMLKAINNSRVIIDVAILYVIRTATIALGLDEIF